MREGVDPLEQPLDTGRQDKGSEARAERDQFGHCGPVGLGAHAHPIQRRLSRIVAPAFAARKKRPSSTRQTRPTVGSGSVIVIV